MLFRLQMKLLQHVTQGSKLTFSTIANTAFLGVTTYWLTMLFDPKTGPRWPLTLLLFWLLSDFP